jgi:four helix bundle protein
LVTLSCVVSVRLLGMTTDSSDTALLAWEAGQHTAITGDPLWRLNCYREALFLLEQVREDVKELGLPGSQTDVKEQLVRSVGSIAANIAEGYGRPSTADRLRFFSFALGSAREAIAWYQTLRPAAEHVGLDDRIERLARIRRMLLGLLTRLRTNGARKFDSW